jgi:hypothetical protein
MASGNLTNQLCSAEIPGHAFVCCLPMVAPAALRIRRPWGGGAPLKLPHLPPRKHQRAHPHIAAWRQSGQIRQRLQISQHVK